MTFIETLTTTRLPQLMIAASLLVYTLVISLYFILILSLNDFISRFKLALTSFGSTDLETIQSTHLVLFLLIYLKNFCLYSLHYIQC